MVSPRDNPGRPPKQWMNRCVRGVGTSSRDPGAVCGSLWYHKMSAQQRREPVSVEEGRALAANQFGGGAAPLVLLGALGVGALLLLTSRSSSAESSGAPPAPSPGTPPNELCPIDLDMAFNFSKAKGYNIHYKTDAYTSWGPPIAKDSADPKSRWFSKPDCSFYKWDGSKWVSDEKTNSEFTAWANSNLKGHPGDLFLF